MTENKIVQGVKICGVVSFDVDSDSWYLQVGNKELGRADTLQGVDMLLGEMGVGVLKEGDILTIEVQRKSDKR